jgi:serine/threonine-protein kinase RsbT
MAAVEPAATPGGDRGSADVAALIPLVRRIVAARVPDPATADDLVQETLTRVLAAAGRVEPGMLEPYAIVTARNIVTSMWRDRDRAGISTASSTCGRPRRPTRTSWPARTALPSRRP